jgi:hypothetical protein
MFALTFHSTVEKELGLIKSTPVAQYHAIWDSDDDFEDEMDDDERGERKKGRLRSLSGSDDCGLNEPPDSDRIRAHSQTCRGRVARLQAARRSGRARRLCVRVLSYSRTRED